MRSMPSPRLLPRLFLLCAGALLAASAHAEIAFGQIVPLTGADAAGGQAMAAGARAYIAKVNAEGGVAGQKISYVVKDNQGQAGQTQAQAAMLIGQDHVYGLLPGADLVQARELATSGLLRQRQVPLLLLRNAAQNGDDTDCADRDTGLIEIAPPAEHYASLFNEYRAALARFGPAGASYSSAGLQGYIAAKVMVGAVRLMAMPPSHEDYFAVLRNMVPDVSSRLAISDSAAR